MCLIKVLNHSIFHLIVRNVFLTHGCILIIISVSHILILIITGLLFLRVLSECLPNGSPKLFSPRLQLPILKLKLHTHCPHVLATLLGVLVLLQVEITEG